LAYGNNGATSTFSSTLASYADLVVKSNSLVVEQPAVVQSGAQVRVGWDDQNSGNAAVNAAFNDYVLVQRVNSDNSLTNIASGTPSGNSTLAAGGTSHQTFTFTLPDGAAGVGNFKVSVTTDNGQSVTAHRSTGHLAYGNNGATSSF